MILRKLMAAALIAAGAAAPAGAADDGERRDEVRIERRGHGPASLEGLAMHNVLTELLVARTGKSADEIRAAFQDAHPHDALRALGLAEEDMRPLFKQAHATLVDKAATAGLITAEQAQTIRSSLRMKHRVQWSDDGS